MTKKTTSNELFPTENESPEHIQEQPTPKKTRAKKKPERGVLEIKGDALNVPPHKAGAIVTPGTNVAPLPPPSAANTLSILLQAVTNPAVDPAKAQVLQEMFFKAQDRDAERAFDLDFLLLSDDLPEIKRDGTIDQGITKSGRQGVKAKYATFENVHEIVSPLLHKRRFTVMFTRAIFGENDVLICTLKHVEGHKKESIQRVVPDPSGGKTASQADASGESFIKRRMLINVLCMRSRAKEDRDLDGSKREKVEQKAAEESAKPVSAEQLKDLREKIGKTGGRIPETRVCEKYGVVKLEDLPMARYADACKALDGVIAMVESEKNDAETKE